jgi:uncharacterized membrane protein
MALLPEGFALPPLPYLLALLAGLAAVGRALRRRRPPVTERLILGLAPWMAVGSALHVLYVLDALPAIVRPLAGTPSVYLAVAVVAGAAWVLADATGVPTARTLAIVGLAALLPAVVAVLAVGLSRGSLRFVWSGVGLLVAAALAGGGWELLRRIRPAVRVTGAVGALALFGHALDGVSTAVGVDVLGFGERTPLSRLILEVAAALPVADVVGVGWLFVLVKLLVAGGVVALLADYVREDPDEGFLLLAFVAAVGVGPGVHNLLLFAVAG